MLNVLSGKYLKYIIDFEHDPDVGAAPATVQENRPVSDTVTLENDSLCRTVIETIEKPPQDLLPQAQAKMDNKTKPLGALGKLEALILTCAWVKARALPWPLIRQMPPASSCARWHPLMKPGSPIKPYPWKLPANEALCKKFITAFTGEK